MERLDPGLSSRELSHPREDEITTSTRSRLRGFAALALLGIGLAAAAPFRPRGIVYVLPEVLRGDLLVEGTVMSVAAVEDSLHGPCRTGFNPSVRQLDVRLRVARVVNGAGIDSVLAVRMTRTLRNAEVAAGQHVLFVGKRACNDGWRVRGDAVRVLDGGALNPDDLEYAQNVVRSPRWVTRNVTTVAAVDSIVRASPIFDLVGPFDRIAGMHVVVATSAVAATDTSAVLSVRPLYQAFGAPHDTPREVRLAFPPLDAGGFGFTVHIGDTLLVPFRAGAGAADESANLRYAEVALGRVAALGVPLAEVERAYAREGDVYRLRRTR